MNLKVQESINDYFQDDTKFICTEQFATYKVQRGYIGGYGDELRLYYTKFEPSIKRASLCIVHGFGEHQGKFLHIAELFANNQFVVHLIDLRGFGYSGGARGSQTIQQLHMDVEVLLRQAQKDLPLFLYGHAMGGLLIVSLLQRNPFLKIAGVITTSPMLGFPLDRKLKGFRYFAVKYLGHYLEDLVINIKTNPTALTKNNQHVQRYFDDKLMMPFLGIAMAQSILNTLNFINPKEFRFPILIMHGKQDSLANYQDSVHFYENCSSRDKVIKLFENGYHELQHDEEFEEIKEIMIKWAVDRTKKADNVGIMIQSRLNYGVPRQAHRKLQLTIILLSCLIYTILVLRYRKGYKLVQQNQRGGGDRRQRGGQRNQRGGIRKFRGNRQNSRNHNQGRDNRPRNNKSDFKDKLDQDLENYKKGSFDPSNPGQSRLAAKLDSGLDTYFQRKGTVLNEKLDKQLDDYWKQTQ